MEPPEQLHLDSLRKIHGRSVDNDTSDSEPETESGNSFGTPRSEASDIVSGDSDIGTPRSGTSDIGTPRSGTSDIGTPLPTASDTGTSRAYTSDDSTSVTSPRANLLWDHGFDVARNVCKSPEERDTEWRRFNNKTDDDKIIADKRRMKIKKIGHKLQELNEREVEQPPDKPTRNYHGLPDLIPSASMSYVHSSVRSSQKTLYAMDDVDPQPPLPDSEPPDMDCSDSPPPLPSTSPPALIKSEVNVLELIADNQCPDDSVDKHDTNLSVTHSSDSDDTSELCNKDPLQLDSEEECSSSAAGDLSDQDYEQTHFDGCYNVQTHTVYKMESDSDNTNTSMDLSDNIEAEFDFILESLKLDSDTQDTYVERFAGRRDRYGFILSPVVEGPSPTPSNMSGYSSYSGISSSSPDPLGIFRMSPGPNRGSKHEIDLSSLCVKPIEWDLSTDQTVPIYQNVQAKRALAIPEGYGWDSGDDLLSPSNGDWDSYDNGLSTPPVSTTSVNFTQFGTHLTGWKQPDVAIFEEPEDDSADTTIDDDTCSDTDSTVYDDSPRDHTEENITVNECESPEKNLLHVYLYAEPVEENPEPNLLTTEDDIDMDRECLSIKGESIHSLELSLLEDEINEVENELKLLKKHSENNGNLIENTNNFNEMNTNVRSISHENYDDGDVNIVALENRLDDSFHEFNAEIADINGDVNTDIQQRTNSDTIISVNSSLGSRCSNPIIRVDSKQTFTTTDDESDTTESYEDAEDEYSASDNDNTDEKGNKSEFELSKAKRKKMKLDDEVIAADMSDDEDDIFVTELLSPRSAILLSGGMFPDETETSSITSDEDVPGEITPDTNMCSYGSGHIKISHYTSGESDDDYIGRMSDKNDEVQCDDKIPNTTQKSFRETADTQEQLLKQDNLPIKEHSVDIIRPITIHSPLDFSLLDSTFESVNRGDIKQSPRVFGRYYAEMDLELLEEVRSKSDYIGTSRSEHEQPNNVQDLTEQTLTIPDSGMPVDAGEFDRSFHNIEFSSSTDANPKITNVKQRSNPDNILTSQIFEIESGAYEPGRKDDITIQMTTFRNSTCAEDKILSMPESGHFVVNQQTDNRENQEDIMKTEDGILDNTIANRLNKKARHRKTATSYSINSETVIQPTTENISSLDQTTSHKSKPVKIKISHLARRGSLGSKVKQGYVHELSELFDNNISNQELDKTECFAKKQKSKQRQNRTERVPTPTFLTANENIIIEESHRLSDSDDISKREMLESLGLEVTPLQKVMSFRRTPGGDNEYKANEDTDSDLFDNNSDGDYSTNSDISSGDYNDELQMYENQLREIENITGELNQYRYCTGEATLLDDDDIDEDYGCTAMENNEDVGTSEFMPVLQTLSEIIEREHSIESSFAQVEINEFHMSTRSMETDNSLNEVEQVDVERKKNEYSIDGESDPDKSVDEDVHENYNHTGDIYQSVCEEIQVNNTGNIDDHDINHRYVKFVDQEQNMDIKYPDEGAGARSFDDDNLTGNKASEPGCPADGIEISENYASPIIALTEVKDTPCERDTEHESNVSFTEAVSKSTDSTVDMSANLQQIQRASLRGRQNDMVAKSTPMTSKSNDTNTRTPPGYLYDILYRIEMGSQPRPNNDSMVESENNKQGESTECFETSTKAQYDMQVEIVGESENTTEEIVPRRSNPYLGIKYNVSPTAVNEQSIDYTVDISGNMQQLPGTHLHGRQKDKVGKSTPMTRNDANTRTQSGYLYDILSRIDMGSQPKQYNGSGVESENNKQGQSTECFETSSKEHDDMLVDVVEKNEDTTGENVSRRLNPYLGIKYNASPTAVNEQGEFECPEHTQTRIVTPCRTKDENKGYIPKLSNASDYNDDARFKIKYPSSLSRRLYGPYSRLRCNENELAENCLSDSEDEREVNPAGLSQHSGDNLHSMSCIPINCHNLDRLNVHTNNQSTESDYYRCGVLNTSNNSFIDGQTHASVSRHFHATCDDSSERDSQTDNVSIHSDAHNSNPDQFNYTCYNVKTPFSSLTQEGDITFNSKAIIDGERNQPWQKTENGENNYVDVKLQHMRNEANSGKQKYDFANTAYCGNIKCGVKFTQLPMHIECTSLDNKYECENWREINNGSLGVNTNTVKNVNDYTTMGVHIPSEASANKTKQENVDMNNDMVSAKGKTTSVKTNLQRINYMPVSVTTQNINSQ